MDRRSLVLQKIWSKKVAVSDHYYGPLTEALATHFGHSAVQILLNANRRNINSLIKGMIMFDKFEDERDNLFRITVKEIPIEELERILREFERVNFLYLKLERCVKNKKSNLSFLPAHLPLKCEMHFVRCGHAFGYLGTYKEI